MKPGNTDVDEYVERSERWPHELAALRSILLETELTEDLKWGKPCYVHGGKNIAIIQQMKGFLALMFFKGTLLDDPDGVLREQGPNSRSAMRIEFTSVDDVARLTDTVRTLVDEAIDVEDAGLQVDPAPASPLVEELQARFDRDPELRAAFEALTPGRRREYNLYFSDAKRPATRVARIEKYEARILGGKGMRDR